MLALVTREISCIFLLLVLDVNSINILSQVVKWSTFGLLCKRTNGVSEFVVVAKSNNLSLKIICANVCKPLPLNFFFDDHRI